MLEENENVLSNPGEERFPCNKTCFLAGFEVGVS